MAAVSCSMAVYRREVMWPGRLLGSESVLGWGG